MRSGTESATKILRNDLLANHLQTCSGNRHRVTRFGDVAGQLNLVAHVRHELRIVVRGEVSCDCVDLAIHQVNPDLVVLDIVMPEMNGLEIAREVCRHAPVPKLISMSSYYTLEEAAMIARIYGDGNFIQKSDVGKELAPTISRLLGEENRVQ